MKTKNIFLNLSLLLILFTINTKNIQADSIAGFEKKKILNTKKLETIKLSTEIDGKTISINDTTTNLNGLNLTFKDDIDISNLSIYKIKRDTIPEEPELHIPITDFFNFDKTIKSNLELRFPLKNIPENVSAFDIKLYCYVEAIGVDGKLWSSISMDTNYEIGLFHLITVIDLGGIYDDYICFIGFSKSSIRNK